MEAFDSGVLDGPVHPFDLTVCPRMFRLRCSMIDVCFGAGVFERVGTEYLSLFHGLLDERNGRATGARRGELDAVVGEHGVDLVGNSFNQAV